MPSDIYQARAIAQLAIRFNWTWIGAVVANNDYGHMAVKVFPFVVMYCICFRINVESMQENYTKNNLFSPLF